MPCVAGELVTITQGLYGQVTYLSDVGSRIPAPVSDSLIQVFDRPVQQGGVVVAQGVSDGMGAFQIELSVGTYALCAETCPIFELQFDELVHADLRTGFDHIWTLEKPGYCSAN